MRIGKKIRAVGLAAATVAAATGVAIITSASPAHATTSQFRGANWAVLGDNFSTTELVLDGLTINDSYSTVVAKATSVYDDMASLMGMNTVRLPVNAPTVSNSTWWTAYKGTIDAALSHGFKVILAYWEDGNASGGKVTNTTGWNNMWNTVISAYASNSSVYFEPMNEPHGYTSTEWRNVAASWLSAHTNAPQGRVLIGGTGYSQDLRDVCNDSRFNSTLLSFHHYAFFYSAMTYDEFLTHIQTRLGNCASRAVMTEYGAAMNSGLNYNDANSTENFVRYLRAIAQVQRNNSMGGTYWPAIGGKPGSIGYDGYSMFIKGGSGNTIDLTIRNASGANRVRYGWGDAVSDPQPSTTPSTYYRINNVNSGKVMDVVGASTANNAEIKQYTWNSGGNQKWRFDDAGSGYFRVVNLNSGKCLDVASASTADGANIIQYTCGTGTNQQWQWVASGSGFQLKARHSGKCLDVVNSGTADSVDIQQKTCATATNQQWTRTAV